MLLIQGRVLKISARSILELHTVCISENAPRHFADFYSRRKKDENYSDEQWVSDHFSH
jgi:hypothetical protein